MLFIEISTAGEREMCVIMIELLFMQTGRFLPRWSRRISRRKYSKTTGNIDQNLNN